MLQNIGDKLKSHRWVGMLLLGALGLIFAMWGAYGIVDISFGTPRYALKVNGEEVAIDDVRQAWQQRQSQLQQQLNGEVPAERLALLQQQLLNEYIGATLIRQRARERGLRVDNQAVITAYQSEPAFQVDGKFNEVAARAMLTQAGLTPAGYEAQLRDSLQVGQLTLALQATDFLTESERNRIFALENEQRQLRYAILPLERFEAAARVDEQQIAARYASHASEYQSAESARLQYAELNLNSIAAQVTVDEAELSAWFETNKARYIEPEKRRARHVLVQLAAGADAATGAAALKKAQEVVAKARSGGDFAALVTQYSDDGGSRAQGGDLGWMQSDASIDAEFSRVLFTLNAGQISDPVKTPFGYHVIKLEQIQAARGRTLADARVEITADYQRDRATEIFGDRQEQLQQKLESGSSDLQALAREFGLQSGEIASFTRAGAAPLGGGAELNAAVFSEEVRGGGRVGGPVALTDDRLVIVKVLEYHAPQTRPLDQVRGEVAEAVRREAGSRAAREAAEAAVKQLDGGAAFDAVLKGLGAAAAPVAWVGRGDPQLPVQVREAAFAVPFNAGRASYRALSLEQGGAALVAVTEVRPGTAGANPANDLQLLADVQRRQREAETAAYLLEMQRRATIKRNNTVFE